MKVVIEVNSDVVMEALGKGIEQGAIEHWGKGTYHPRVEERSPWIHIEETLPGRSHTVKHRLGERALKQGLEYRMCAGLQSLEAGKAPASVVDKVIQFSLFGEELHARPDRQGSFD